MRSRVILSVLGSDRPGLTQAMAEAVYASGGNPYGVSVTAGGGGPTEADLAHARYLGKRVAEVADRLAR